jgi:hypothetical protein
VLRCILFNHHLHQGRVVLRLFVCLGVCLKVIEVSGGDASGLVSVELPIVDEGREWYSFKVSVFDALERLSPEEAVLTRYSLANLHLSTCSVAEPGSFNFWEAWDPSDARQLWKVSKGSRCAGSYAISRSGMSKMLVHLPMWCSMDFTMNGAKHAPTRADLRTTVLFLEPPLFDEGSKSNVFETVMQ